MAAKGNRIKKGNDFNGSIVNGIFDVMLGSPTTLDLNYGSNYWMDLEINGNDLDFSGNERKQFEASRGLIDNSDLDSAAGIAWSKISKTNSNLSELGFDSDFNKTFIRQADGNLFYVAMPPSGSVSINRDFFSF